MIRGNLSTRARPEALGDQYRAVPARKRPARAIYLGLVICVGLYLLVLLVGPYVALQSGGIVTRERFTAASPYTSRIVKVHVSHGDRVKPGDPLITVESPDALDTSAKLSGQRNTLLARELQAKARLATVESVLPIARERGARAVGTSAEIATLKSKGFVPLNTQTEVGRELFESAREEATLVAESKALRDELASLRTAMSEVDTAFEQLRRSYSDGVIRSPAEGIVGSHVPNQGAVIRAGDAMLDVLYGSTFVLAYLPIGRLYDVHPQMPVVITDGLSITRGHIERIEGVADALPSEFQNAFRPTDRQQIMQISFDDQDNAFPVLSKVEVSGIRGFAHILTQLKQGIASVKLMPSDQELLEAARHIDGLFGAFSRSKANARETSSILGPKTSDKR